MKTTSPSPPGRMLVEAGANVNKTTQEGRSALLYAASKGRENIVTFLIRSGADVNKADKLGATPLHRSVQPDLVADSNFLFYFTTTRIEEVEETRLVSCEKKDILKFFMIYFSLCKTDPPVLV